MARNVLRSFQVEISPTKAHISPPVMPKRHFSSDDSLELAEPEEVVEQYSGPTADQLRLEAEAFSSTWEEQKSQMIEAARLEAERIIKEAEEVAFDEVKRKTSQANEIRSQAEIQEKNILSATELRVQAMLDEAQQKVADIESAAYQRGLENGRVEGWEQSKGESERLVDRLHVVLNKTIERRAEIIDESEAQIVALVLSISRKIVKVLTENQRNVVVNNVLQALRKLKNKSDVSIRVNIEDLKVTSDHIKEVVSRIERVGNVTVLEDSQVDPGGCIIETDFGEIDARISSQFKEIEDKILEVTPIRTRVRENNDGTTF